MCSCSGWFLFEMRLATSSPVQDSVLSAPVRVLDLPGESELRSAFRSLIVDHRLRAPVTGAHLVHKKLTIWEGRQASVAGHSELRINGVPWVLPAVERFGPRSGEPHDAVADLVSLNPDFTAVEGYLLMTDPDGRAILRPGCWAVTDRRSDLVDPTHGHRGVPVGWVYIGIGVHLDVALQRAAGEVVRVDELPLRRQTINALHGTGIERLEHLLELSHADLRGLPGIGAVAEQEIDAALATVGRHLPSGIRGS